MASLAIGDALVGSAHPVYIVADSWKFSNKKVNIKIYITTVYYI